MLKLDAAPGKRGNVMWLGVAITTAVAAVACQAVCVVLHLDG